MDSSSGNTVADARLKAEIWLAFKSLKPLCEGLLTHHTKSSEQNLLLVNRLQELREEIKLIPMRGLEAVSDFVALPLIALIKFYAHSISNPLETSAYIDKVIEGLLDTLSLYIGSISKIDSTMFTKTFDSMINLTTLPNLHWKPSKPGDVIPQDLHDMTGLFSAFSEEARMTIMNIIKSIFEKYDFDPTEERRKIDLIKRHQNQNISQINPSDDTAEMIDYLDDPESLTSISFLVYRLLDICVKDKSRKNQLYGIQTLISMINRIPNIAIISYFTPATITSSVRIIMGDYKQGQDVIIAAYQLMGLIICKTMSDGTNPFCQTTKNSNTKFSKNSTSSSDVMAALRSMASLRTSKLQQGSSQDESLKQESRRSDETQSKQNQDHLLSRKLVPPKRDQEWFQNSSYHINLVVSRLYSISRMIAEENSRNVSMNSIIVKSQSVRLQMAKTAIDIINDCKETLTNLVPTLFEVIVMFSFDEVLEISTLCEAQLEHFAKTMHSSSSFNAPFDISKSSISSDPISSPNSNFSMPKLLEKNLMKLVSSLPRLVRDHDNNKKILVLRLIGGYLRLLRESLPSTLFGNFPSIVHSLQQILEFDYSDSRFVHKQANPILLLESSTTSTTSKSASNKSHLASNGISPSSDDSFVDDADQLLHQMKQTYKHSFKHFRDEQVLQSIQTILRQIGAFGDFNYIMDQVIPFIMIPDDLQRDFDLSDDMEESDEDQYSSIKSTKNSSSSFALRCLYGPQSLLILNELTLGAAGFLNYSSTSSRVKLTKQKQAQFKNQISFLLQLLLSEQKQQSLNFQMLGCLEVFRKTLLLESISNIAMMYGSQFNSQLSVALFPLLQELGSPSSYVANNAKLCLERISIFCGHLSIIDLVNANMDFVVDSIVHEMRYMHDMEASLLVLHGVLSIAESLMVPLLDDLLDEIFKGLDERHKNYTHRFLVILYGVVKAVSKEPHKTPAEIRQYNRERQHINRISTHDTNHGGDKSKYSSGTTPTAGDDKDIELLQDFTMNNWIRRCDAHYSKLPSDDDSTSTNSNSQDITISLYSADASDEERSKTSNPDFSMSMWLNSRIKMRLGETTSLPSSVSEEDGPNGSKFKSAEEFFLDHHRKKQKDEALGNDQHGIKSSEFDENSNDNSKDTSNIANADDDIDSDEEYDFKEGSKPVKKPHRPGYDFVQKILEKLQHWMNTGNLESRIIVMETLKIGLGVLSEHRKVLLPMIHTLWQPLQWRFLDSDPRIVNKSLTIMRTMAMVGKSFVTRRFIDDLWPLLQQVITIYNIHTPQGSKNIAKSNIISQYTRTVDQNDQKFSNFLSSQSFKVQEAALVTIITAIKHLKLPVPILVEIANACWFYLSELQPPALQNLGIKLFNNLASLIPNNIWLLLVELCHCDTIPPDYAVEVSKRVMENRKSGNFSYSFQLIPPMITIAPEKFKVSPIALSTFYSQFNSNATQLLKQIYHPNSGFDQ